MRWWAWLLIGIGAGMLITGIPVCLWFDRFTRDLDRATGWAG